MTKTIELTSLQLHKAIEAIGGYRHDMRDSLERLDEFVLSVVENKLIEKYREIKPDFVPFY